MGFKTRLTTFAGALVVAGAAHADPGPAPTGLIDARLVATIRGYLDSEVVRLAVAAQNDLRAGIADAAIAALDDLMLLKVDAEPAVRSEVRGLVNDFRGRVVDVGPEQMIVEISGQEKKIEAFIDLMRPYGIRELARTGRIALVRSSAPLPDIEADDEPAAEVVGHSSL